MKRVVRASTMLILAVSCWETGGIVMDSEARASHEGELLPDSKVIQQAATPSGAARVAAAGTGRVEVRPVEFAATASEEWTLPREGASTLQLRASGGYVRCHVRLARVDGDQIQVRA